MKVEDALVKKKNRLQKKTNGLETGVKGLIAYPVNVDRGGRTSCGAEWNRHREALSSSW